VERATGGDIIELGRRAREGSWREELELELERYRLF